MQTNSPIRLVVLGAGGRHKTEAALVRAAQALGHAARVVDVVGWTRRLGPLAPALLRRLTDRYAPTHIVATRHAIRLGSATVARLVQGRQAVFWYFDLSRPPRPEVLELARAVGHLLVTCPGQAEAYRAAGVPRVGFMPQAVDPVADRPATDYPAGFECDVSFIGSGQYPHRHAVLAAVAGRFDLQIRGPGWDPFRAALPITGGPLRGASFAQAVRAARINLGANATAEQDVSPLCQSNRMWKVMGCGGFFLGARVPGIEQFARAGEHCAWYASPAEAVDLCRHYLDRPEERAAIAAAGRAHALAHHHYGDRLRRILAGEDYPAAQTSV